MKRVFTLLAACCACLTGFSRQYVVKSPSQRILITVSDDNGIQWSVKAGNTVVTLPSRISLRKNSSAFSSKVLDTDQDKDEAFNELTLKLQDNLNIEFRAYDDAAAYRFVNLAKHPFEIKEENSEFRFAGDYKATVPYINDNAEYRYSYSFESYYDKQNLSQLYRDSLIITPLAVSLPDGKKAVIMEGGLFDYPGMFLKKGEGNSFTSEFAPCPVEEKAGGFQDLIYVPAKTADYIAKVEGRRTFPWRVIVVTDKDADLLTCDIARRLGPKNHIKDTSWIKPGKVAWEWWNNCNITGVDFRSGMNTPTYKYYIDFAQKNHLEYIIIDEGWSDPEDLYKVNPDINLPEVIRYGKEKGVGVILWSGYRNLIQHGLERVDEIMQHYESMGVKGLKVDFFNRDDQKVQMDAYHIAVSAAKHHLLLDFHGLKPTGLQFAYPNILNFEAVKGLENSKWEPRNNNGPIHDQPEYDCEIPYLRMLAGPLDYTPGAMTNATKSQFFGNNDHPMSQGTRVHQMAMYIVYHAPLEMLADSPTKYMKNQECTDFISGIPTTWDESVALGGEMGKWAAIARRKGTNWYIGVLNNWEARDITINISRLKTGGKTATVFEDGINADKDATDYHCRQLNIDKDLLSLHLAPGGGYTARIK